MGTGRKGKSLLIAGALVLATVGGSSSAGARGQSPATACRQVGSNGTLVYGTDGSLGNSHNTQSLTVSCPIDWQPIDQGAGEAGGTVELLDSSPAAITCTIRAEDALSFSANTATRSSDGNANAYVNMLIGGAATVLDGGVHVVCTVPPAEPGTGEMSFIVSLNIL